MNFNTLFKTDSDAAFTTALDDINKRGNSLQLDIQLYLHAVATHWVASGDVRPAVKRINALIDKKTLFKGVRRNAIMAWVEVNLGFALILEGDNAQTFHANKAKAAGIDLDSMSKKANHWYNATPEPDATPVDLNVMLAAFVKKATARNAKANDADNIDPEQLAALAALIKPDADAYDAAAALDSII